jgi:hypothetical protein
MNKEDQRPLVLDALPESSELIDLSAFTLAVDHGPSRAKQLLETSFVCLPQNFLKVLYEDRTLLPSK